jgi:hypothetical protein
MPAITYIPIATTTLGSDQASITFSGISTSYTDIRLILQSGIANAGFNSRMRFNSDTNSNYGNKYAYTAGSGTPTSGNGSNSNGIILEASGSGQRTPCIFHIYDFLNYNATSLTKNSIGSIYYNANVTDGSYGYVGFNGNVWQNTSTGLNAISIVATSGNIASGSTATIYGILRE